ncbi:hypothetical protein SB379_06870 [Burkholderia multivorans]|nr:hypothetical protein [Burkholderia multivorans]MBR8020189.1 hypothetical protein [Burkholderia multivorans]MEB2511597.1 hypothetical protein [Burkholderia multivorans]MEB2521199.1 hypothetical protein [Burkholderia multivorans]MEB2573378.1 hypothetical protein [Burkholderia multivorans]MEB2590538.1 hypothetical protein [Burkholderia multivorans]
MIDNVGDNGGFAENLKKFYEHEHISKHQYEGLKTALNIGHAAIHRGHTPTQEQLVFVVDTLDVIPGFRCPRSSHLKMSGFKVGFAASLSSL